MNLLFKGYCYMYTVTSSATTVCSNTAASTRNDFKLLLTELKSPNGLLQPNTFISEIAVSTSKSFDLVPLGSKVRLLSFKSTRPVSVFLVTDEVEFELPRSTYLTYLVDSTESVLETIESVRVEVPPAPVTAPSPAPSRYPNVIFELLAVVDRPNT